MKFLIVFFSVFSLLGCQSEIDKCVNAGLKASESDKKSSSEKASDEFAYREYCLKAAAGKQ